MSRLVLDDDDDGSVSVIHKVDESALELSVDEDEDISASISHSKTKDISLTTSRTAKTNETTLSIDTTLIDTTLNISIDDDPEQQPGRLVTPTNNDDDEEDDDVQGDNDDDDDDEDDDADGIIKVLRPPTNIFTMKVGCKSPNSPLRQIADPICRAMFLELERKGYAKSLHGTYLYDFDGVVVDDDIGTHPLLYAVFDADDNLIKIGYTTNMKYRKQHYNNQSLVFVVLVHLHRLDAETEQYLQQKYRQMCEEIQNSTNTPEAFKKLFHMIVDRGGEELGCKKKIIHLMCELGGSLHYNLEGEADFLMCDTTKLEERETHVAVAVTTITTLVKDSLDVNTTVDVPAVSSWMTGFDESRQQNPNANFSSTPTFMEYILNVATIDMEETNTFPAPVYRNPTSSEQGFSKDYSKEQLNQGRSRLHNFIRNIKDNSFMILDTNQILFDATPGDIVSLLPDQYLFDVAMDVWEREIVLLVHAVSKKVIAVHRPLSDGADSREIIRSSQCVLRCMGTEVLKRIVHSLRGEVSDFTADAIIGGYAYEYIRHALHFSGKPFAAAAFVRDAITRPVDYPLRQNRLRKTVSDPNYPITPGLRERYHRAEPYERELNPLVVLRACNLLTFVDDADDMERIESCIKDVDTLIKEDQPSLSTISRRWVATLNGIDPTCLLRQVIEDASEERKPNKGNLNAYGLTDEEKIKYNDDFLHMESLPLQTPFWVRSSDHQDPVPTTANDRGHIIFSTFTFKGLQGRVREKRSGISSGNEALRFNTTHYIAVRPKQVMTLLRVRDTNGQVQYIGEDGQKSFVLVHLKAYSPDINKAKQTQLGMIENLELGTHFVVRKNSKSSSDIQIPVLPNEYADAQIFNLPVWLGVRDRLYTINRSIKEIKTVDLGDWMLGKVVEMEQRKPRPPTYYLQPPDSSSDLEEDFDGDVK